MQQVDAAAIPSTFTDVPGTILQLDLGREQAQAQDRVIQGQHLELFWLFETGPLRPGQHRRRQHAVRYDSCETICRFEESQKLGPVPAAPQDQTTLAQ